jgi:tetratricopeptide (TPR) repeat protein
MQEYFMLNNGSSFVLFSTLSNLPPVNATNKKLMPKRNTLLFLTMLPGFVFAQSNYEQFKNLFKNNDSIKIKSLLTEWEKTNPDDPELYTSAINFYFVNSRQEIISLQSDRKNKQGFELTDSTGKVVGFLNSGMDFNREKLSKAIAYANKGIDKFPNRLDIRFGKCYILQQIEDWSNFAKELTRTIEYSQVNKNNWLWTENRQQIDGEHFFVETIQTYLKELYDTEDDNLLPYMIEIGEATLKYYHSSVEILSTTAVALMLTKNYDKALEYLQQAEKINPKDFIVLNNIAQGYKLKGDKANAIKYYRLTEKYGDEQAKQQAKENIKALEK